RHLIDQRFVFLELEASADVFLCATTALIIREIDERDPVCVGNTPGRFPVHLFRFGGPDAELYPAFGPTRYAVERGLDLFCGLSWLRCRTVQSFDGKTRVDFVQPVVRQLTNEQI